MKRVIAGMFALFCIPVILSSPALAITITSAEVQGAVAIVNGSKATKGVNIIWENAIVTKSTKGGSFQFQGTVPSDCVGTLSDGVSTLEVALGNCLPEQSLYPLRLPVTGQTYCASPRDDGCLQMGVKWPIPRFINNNDGTVTDRLTNLVWLKDATCSGTLYWYPAVEFCNTLQSGMCGLTDESVAGDWRLPNRNELLSLIDISSGIALPIGHPFIVAEHYYWTSSSHTDTAYSWYVNMGHGSIDIAPKSDFKYSWPVRSLK